MAAIEVAAKVFAHRAFSFENAKKFAKHISTYHYRIDNGFFSI